MFTKSFEFNVGRNEVHKVSFNLSKWFGSVSIKVDGEVKFEYTSPFLPAKIPFEIEVGGIEKHKIKFQLITPLFFSAFRETRVKVFVDEKFQQEY